MSFANRTSKLILASASPRRRQLLAGLGLPFEAIAVELDEQGVNEPTPDRLVRRLAVEKAERVARQRPDAIVIGADTVVVHGGEVLGKPRDASDAVTMLRRLSGQTHHVYTGVAVVCQAEGRELVEHEVTAVTFGELTPRAIERYVASGEPLDKAGAYGIQGVGATLVRRVEGCYFNVVGLPLYRLARMLAAFGIEIP